MTNYTVYQSARGGGKTHWIINQIAGLLVTADGPFEIALLVPFQNCLGEFTEWNIPVEIFTEATLDAMRGRRFDYIFVDNADLFRENPLELCARYAPGVPASFTYTPFVGSSLPKPLPKPEPRPRLTSDEIQLTLMRGYIASSYH